MPAGVDDVLGAIARHRLPGVVGPRSVEPSVLDPTTWPTVAGALTRERLTGLAVLAIGDGACVIDRPEDEADLAERDRLVQAQAVRAERLTLDLCAELEAADVRHLVLKGPANAHGPYPGPATRPFVDVDLLVPGHALGYVVAACEAQGARRLVPELRRGFDRRFAKSVTLRHPSGVDIDLHRTLVLGPLTHLVRIDDLWDRPGWVEVLPDRRIPVLHPDPAFLHACLHLGAGGPPRWLTVRDVLETERAADLDRCREMARRWTATGVVLDAIALTRRRGLPVSRRLGRWAAALEPTPTERRVAASYRLPRRSSRRVVIAGWRHVPGLRAKMSFGGALVLPSAEHRRARHRSLAGDVRRILGRAA